MTATWEELGFAAGAAMHVAELLSGANLGVHTGSVSVSVNCTDSAALLFTPVA
jgi:hypothetical protein